MLRVALIFKEMVDQATLIRFSESYYQLTTIASDRVYRNINEIYNSNRRDIYLVSHVTYQRKRFFLCFFETSPGHLTISVQARAHSATLS